jgi:hypothetical protein
MASHETLRDQATKLGGRFLDLFDDAFGNLLDVRSLRPPHNRSPLPLNDMDSKNPNREAHTNHPSRINGLKAGGGAWFQ